MARALCSNEGSRRWAHGQFVAVLSALVGLLEDTLTSSSWRLVKEDGLLSLLCSINRFLQKGWWA